MPPDTPAAPAGPQPGMPQQSSPPFGASPATGPTPNKGYEAAAAQRLGLVIKQLTDLVALSGATSEVGQAALKMLNIGVKLVPAGSVTPAAEKNNIEQMAMRNAQGNQQMQALKAQREGGGAAPAGGPAGAPTQMPQSAQAA